MMLPTKGYFQDIECPFNKTTCGRPYCHFRHKRKPNETVVEDNAPETTTNAVPTYKPTPKSELANIHNNKSHIPISYVPDLAFKRERPVRPLPRIEKPTYKPTPLSILSSATKLDTSLPENHEHKEVIKDIQDNIASNVYDPLKSEINFEDLSNEFDLIDDIINNDTDVEPSSAINENLNKLRNDIEKEQNKLNVLQSELSTGDLKKSKSDNLHIVIKTEPSPENEAKQKKNLKLNVLDKVVIKKEKVDEEKSSDWEEKDKSEKKDKKNEKEIKSFSKDRSKKSSSNKEKTSGSKDRTYKDASKEKEKSSVTSEKTFKSHKSGEREKHRKEEKKNSSKDRGDNSSSKHKSKHRSRESRGSKESKKDPTKSKKRRNSGSNSESVSKEKRSKRRTDSSSESESDSNNSGPDQNKKSHHKESSSKGKKQKSTERSRSKHKAKEKDKKLREESRSRSRSRSASKDKGSKIKHKSRQRSVSKSRQKEKEKRGGRSKEKDKDKDKVQNRSSESEKEKGSERGQKHKNKEKDRDRIDKTKSKNKPKDIRPRKDDKKEKRKKSTSESNMSQFDNDSDMFQPEDDSMAMEDIIPSDIDLDLEDEDETMRECFRIFSEYTPTPIQSAAKVEEVERRDLFEEDGNLYLGKKRTAHAGAEISSSYSKLPPPPKPKAVPLPGQTLANRYRIAQIAQGSNEQENIMNEVRNITQQPNKRPATSLLEAARQHKIKKLQLLRLKEKEKAGNIVDRILNGTHSASQSQVKVVPKKIAAVPNVALIEKARERISLIKKQRMETVKTVAQTQKGGRVAHVPEFNLSDIPDVLQADKSKLPVNVRTRFLTMIVEECSKLYALKEDAYNRALNEEFTCYEKCKVLATYRNSAMLAVNRLRKEIQDREVKGLGRLLSGETGTTEKESDFKGKRFYENVRKWILTEEELDVHGYPKESGTRGKAVINNRKEVDYSMADDSYRKCSRCSRVYQVDDDGWPLYEEECMYHPLKKRTIRGEQVFLCCKSSDDTGCATSDTHVSDGLKEHLLEGYQTTLPPESDDDPRNIAVYALDCEMCYTTKGLELTRVTIVDIDSKTVYESLVKPLNPIIDYNTRFSGITKDQMDRTSTSILQIQANILHLCNSETILVGHSLESDMKALKIVHGTVIDTSVLFPHKMGLPHKRALRALASEYLKKIIQNDVSGHDSAEDAITCMELIKWKLKEELKTRTK